MSSLDTYITVPDAYAQNEAKDRVERRYKVAINYILNEDDKLEELRYTCGDFFTEAIIEKLEKLRTVATRRYKDAMTRLKF